MCPWRKAKTMTHIRDSVAHVMALIHAAQVGVFSPVVEVYSVYAELHVARFHAEDFKREAEKCEPCVTWAAKLKRTKWISRSVWIAVVTKEAA